MEKIKKNGLTTKLLACWINALLIFFVLKAFFYACLMLPMYLYFPFAFTFIAAFIAYSIICISLRCRTLGRYLLDINIKKPFKNAIRYLAAISLLISIVCYFGNMICLWSDFKQMKLTSTITHSFENRDANLLQEVSSLSEQDYSTLSKWVENNKVTPEEYVIQIAKNHKITLMGEVHGVKNYIDFFNDIIPNLYHQAGVRCIAMECIPSSMNSKIEKLINAKEFDERLLIQISRHGSWNMWGFEEYWNVLRTAWKLNNNLKPDERRLRVVGIDSEWNGPNFALVFSRGEDGIQNVSFVEKFRAFTLASDLVKMIYRDEIMARNIEKEAIEKNDKCVVWVGSYHSFVNYGQGIFDENKKLIRYNNRMGIMLCQKYKSDIFQIVLHMPDKISDDLFNKVIFQNELAPVGFTVENSPFAMLRDSAKYLYNNLPTVSFSDIAQGYLYFIPFDSTRHCNWIPDYISKKMFLKSKPFYEGKIKQKFNNNKEVNNYFMQYIENYD